METQTIERLQNIHRLWIEINKASSSAYYAAFRSNKTMTSYIRNIAFELSDRLALFVQPEYNSLNQRYQVRIPKVPKESQDSGLNQGF